MERKWLNIPQEAYHDLRAVSSGGLRCFAVEGPLDYYNGYIARTVKPTITEAKELGTAFHKAMECRDLFEKSYLILPDYVRDEEFVEDVCERLDAKGSKAKRPKLGDKIDLHFPGHKMYIQCWEDRAKAQGREVLDEDGVKHVERMVRSVYDNPAIVDYLDRGKAEVAVVAVCPETGIPMKALIDLLPDSSVWLDYKTTRRGSLDAFWRDFNYLAYDYQFAWYERVSGITNHKVVAVRNDKRSYEAQILDVPTDIIRHRHEDNRRTLLQLKQLEDQAEGSPIDSMGVPHVYHNEGWGSEIDPRLLFGVIPDEVQFDD